MTTDEYDQQLYEIRKAEGTECANCHSDRGWQDPIGFYYDEYLHESCQEEMNLGSVRQSQ